MTGSWWCREGLDIKGGRLKFAGRDAEAIAREHGTPLYVFDTARMEANARRLASAFDRAGASYRILFALKANRQPEVLDRLRATRLVGIDACSPNEVDLAIEHGWRPEEISYTGTSLSPRDLDRILAHPIRLNLDSLSAIRQVGERSPGRAIGLRINPGVGAGFSSRMTYSGEKPTKFGIYPDQIEEALALAGRHQLVVRGLHFHIGSGWLNEGIERVVEAARRVAEFAKLLPAIDYINVGGGIGVRRVESEREVDLDAYASGIAGALADLKTTILCEPGDFIAQDAGILLAEVVCIDRKGGVDFVGVDCGYNVYCSNVFFNLPQEVVLCRAAGGPTVLHCTLAGNINEASDIFTEDCRLPEVREGDVLALLNTGGYGAALSSTHCHRPHAGIVSI